MKHSVIITIALALASQIAFAGSITDTYTAGDTLTAAKMNNIKNAVNGNATDISGNTTNIGINALGISNNATNIAAGFSGDGSAGDLSVNTDTYWPSNPPTNPNYNNITLDAGMTLTVSAGTTIRCTGDFINYGTLQVINGPQSGGIYDESSVSVPRGFAPHSGDTMGHAGTPDHQSVPQGTEHLNAGYAGPIIPMDVAMTSFGSFRYGGGGGSGYSNGPGDGGGLVKVYCTGSIINNGTISANGSDGSDSGGGAGGIVVLASINSIENIGTISATGGIGANSRSYVGNGGGGGGGLIILAAPTITNDIANYIVTGGTGGTGTATLSLTLPLNSNGWNAGGAGGSCGGSGGTGGNVNAGVPALGNAGSDGYILEISANPLFLNY